ncbi:MAG: DNA-directed RNA polymerase subunit alpha [Gemmatimonadota bacterium]|nr:MAG: DNA-directed RNA polymerase subunit alpha [Gemmatimonadota bacterium]
MPRGIEFDDSTLTDSYGKMTVQPLEQGFGTTLGNSLRRVLLSSLQGAAPVFTRVEGVEHEFSTVPGVREDVTEMVLNLKGLEFRYDGEEIRKGRLEATGEKQVTAADFVFEPDVELLNPDQYIATINKGASLSMEIGIMCGRGYVLADQHKLEEQPLGTIALDSLFSPVKKVRYEVEATRVGQRTDYDGLVMEIWTDGSITPVDAVAHASKIMKDHLMLFINFDEEPEIVEEKEYDEEFERMRELLNRSVDELELSVRSSNCLTSANIRTIGELVQKSEAEMLKQRNFGRKSLKEIQEILQGMNLSFGMDVSKWATGAEESVVAEAIA